MKCPSTVSIHWLLAPLDSHLPKFTGKIHPQTSEISTKCRGHNRWVPPKGSLSVSTPKLCVRGIQYHKTNLHLSMVTLQRVKRLDETTLILFICRM